MKKMCLVGLLLTTALLTACTTPAQQQAEREALETIEALPTNVIEDEPQTEVVVEEPTEVEPQVETPAVQPVSNTEWASQTMDSDMAITITYTNGVPDDFKLSNGLTFGQYADYMAKCEDRFDKEQFRKTFSCFYGYPDYYNQMRAVLTPAQMEYDLLLLTSVSWETYNHFGNLQKTVHYGNQIFYVTDFSKLSGATGYFVWDETQLPGDTYLAYELSATAQKTLYNCTVFTDDTLEFWLTCMYLAYDDNGVANPWEDGSTTTTQPQQQTTTTTTTSTTLSSLNFAKMRGYEAEIESAVEKYYGSEITSVEDVSTGEMEIAYIYLSNGKRAKFCGGSTMSYVYNPDDSSTANIWEIRY